MPPGESAAPSDRPARDPPAYRARVVAERRGAQAQSATAGRASSAVTREDLDRRQPRSAPDALRYEAGVFVQQTAHGQGSAYLRGLTGYQTLLLFDGVRINNATFRQGPNQYFFTLDARTIDSIEVLRGGASTRWGSDALGGALQAFPSEPRLLAPGDDGVHGLLAPQARAATADRELGGRAQLELSLRRGGLALGLLGGFGGREVGLLKAGGPIENPDPTTPLGRYPAVPRFAADGKTQLGTGFRELSGDLRLVATLGDGPSGAPRHRLTLAGYVYRQYDVPRTDQCPAPTAPLDSCLIYDEQFRHLIYGAYEHRGGRPALASLRVTLSWQQQHERQRQEQPELRARNLGVDDVDTVGLTARAESAWLTPPGRAEVAARVGYGGEVYLDLLRSSAALLFTDTLDRVPRSRGQYLDGSRYLQGGLYADAELRLPRRLVLRGGARLSLVRADAPADPESGTAVVASTWLPLAGRLGLEWRATDFLRLLVNVDHAYRAPNLNDLTARQQTGPGFQFENAALGPERATTFEVGAALLGALWAADLWAYQTLLQGAILKVSRGFNDCPLQTPQCQGSWSRFQLQNAEGLSLVRGAEGALRLRLPLSLARLRAGVDEAPRGTVHLRASLSYAFGDGPRQGGLPERVPGLNLPERVPLSRIPPLNGAVELWWARRALSLGAALRWAAPQERLALADYADGRIPKYGTPGFAVVDLRASYALARRLLLSLIVENIADAAYRYHGSSVNGPGRGLILAAKIL